MDEVTNLKYVILYRSFWAESAAALILGVIFSLYGYDVIFDKKKFDCLAIRGRTTPLAGTPESLKKYGTRAVNVSSNFRYLLMGVSYCFVVITAIIGPLHYYLLRRIILFEKNYFTIITIFHCIFAGCFLWMCVKIFDYRGSHPGKVCSGDYLQPDQLTSSMFSSFVEAEKGNFLQIMMYLSVLGIVVSMCCLFCTVKVITYAL